MNTWYIQFMWVVYYCLFLYICMSWQKLTRTSFSWHVKATSQNSFLIMLYREHFVFLCVCVCVCTARRPAGAARAGRAWPPSPTATWALPGTAPPPPRWASPAPPAGSAAPSPAHTHNTDNRFTHTIKDIWLVRGLRSSLKLSKGSNPTSLKLLANRKSHELNWICRQFFMGLFF